MLPVLRMAYPHPLASTCCCQVGPAGPRPPPGPPAPGGSGPRAAPRPGPKPPPNSSITGTGPAALAGVVNANWMSTVICGYAELSTWPTSVLEITATSPTVSLLVLVTSHVTFGTTLGTRP